MSETVVLNNIKIINFEAIIRQQIEPSLHEDVSTYFLEKNSLLFRRFIVFRLSEYFIKCVSMSRKENLKLLLYLPPSTGFNAYGQYSQFLRNNVRIISKLLSINCYVGNMTFSNFIELLCSKTGEGKEVQAKLGFVFNRLGKKPNIQKFVNFLNKNNISRLQGEIANDFNFKLGLFVT